MAKFLEHVIAALAWIAVIAAGVWFGGPMIYRHFLAAEQAVQTVQAEEGARKAETVSANAQQASCYKEIAASVQAGAAIAKAARPQALVVGQPRPMIGADQIRGMMQ
jgi:hypothetical protein